jgi:hypothetical protein
MYWPIVIVALAVVVLVVALVLLGRKAERARAEALQEASVAMGFSFEAEGDLDQIKALGDLPLYARGHGSRLKNMLSGRAGADDAKIFDYQYTTGGGKESHTWKQTVALYAGGGRNLPDFVLAPENVFHKLGQLLGYQDIDFDSSPLFSSRYLLRGPDEAAIRSAFTVDTRAFFEQEPGWTVEVQGGNVGIYRAGKQVAPEDLGAFVQETANALRALTHR